MQTLACTLFNEQGSFLGKQNVQRKRSITPLFAKSVYGRAICIKDNKISGSNIFVRFSPCGIFDKMALFPPIFNCDLEQGK